MMQQHKFESKCAEPKGVLSLNLKLSKSVMHGIMTPSNFQESDRIAGINQIKPPHLTLLFIALKSLKKKFS